MAKHFLPVETTFVGNLIRLWSLSCRIKSGPVLRTVVLLHLVLDAVANAVVPNVALATPRGVLRTPNAVPVGPQCDTVGLALKHASSTRRST